MSTAGYLQDAKNQQKKLAETITSKGITATATEKYKDLVDKVAQIENLKGEERTLENFTNVLSEPKSIVQLEYPEPKNLFDINNPTYAALSKANTAFLPTIEDGVISFNTYYSQRGGSGFVIPVEPNTTITISFDSVGSDYWTEIMAVESILDNVAINIYKYPQFKNITKYTLTQKAGKHYILFILDGVNGYYTAKIKNLQIEKGSTATTYEPYTKTLNAKLGSKNLFTPNTTPTAPSAMGLTCTYDSTDNTFTLNGTLATNENIDLATLNIPLDDYYIARYYVSGEITVPEGVTYQSLFAMFVYGSSSQYLERLPQYSNNYNTPIIAMEAKNRYSIESADKWTFYIQNFGVGTVFDNYKFKIAVIKKDIYYTNIPYTPFISDFSTVNVTRCGKNLIPYPYTNTSRTISGVNFTIQSDGSITANGTATANIVFELETDTTMLTLPAGNYFLSGCPSGGTTTSYFMAVANGAGITYTKFQRDFGSGISVSSNGEKWKITIRVISGYTADNLVFKPQIELGSTATPYEPYQGQTYTSTPTGEVTGITNLYPTTTLLTDNAGVVFEQVTGGSYKEILPSTDKNGITKVYQPSVDSSIDSNIKPENIKKGVKILGILGTYDGN